MYPSWMTVSCEVTPSVSCSNNVCELNYPCSDSYSCKPYKITLKRGLYHVDVFGAEGGGYSTPGKGGEIKGFLKINKNSTFFAYVGAKGEKGANKFIPATFGGGGAGYGYKNWHNIGSGGGASDLRTDKDSLSSRIIVAGGGGAGGFNSHSEVYNDSPGGDGSGDNGKSAVSSKGTAGSGAFTNKAGENGIKGIFGYGGNATESEGYEGSGGGGGYYGGNSGKSYCSGGGGGSGYINKNYFRKYKTFTGVRQGHGLIKITFLSSYIINNVVRSADKIFFLFIVLISSK